ncbi:MAG: YceI family protein [Bacteroidota bacterium]|nr:YceI family protein [Bacteroidota bacterium]
MKKLFLLFVLALSQVALFAQTKWTVDNVHSSIKFTVSHLVISEVEGTFKTYSGTVMASKPDFTDAAIDFTVEVKSISTDNEMRDTHLKSADFFDAEKYPQMTFKSTSFKKLTANKYLLTGNLTIHGITKSVKFDVTYGGTANDGYGNTKAGFKATTKINRFDYGLQWNKLTEAGGATVGKIVTINIKLELAKAK